MKIEESHLMVESCIVEKSDGTAIADKFDVFGSFNVIIDANDFIGREDYRLDGMTPGIVESTFEFCGLI